MVVINNIIRDYDANRNDQVDLPSEYTGTSPSLSKVDLAAEISYFDVSAASGDHLDLHDKDIIGDYLLQDCND